MKFNELHTIYYLCYNYGGTVSGANGGLVINLKGQNYILSLKDKERYGCYRFYHNSTLIHKNSSLSRGMFIIWCHALYDEYEVSPTWEDWVRFSNDAHRFITGR